MSIRIKFKAYNDSKFIRWAKLSLFSLGSLIAIPMMVIAGLLFIIENITSFFVRWLMNKTDTDVNWN